MGKNSGKARKKPEAPTRSRQGAGGVRYHSTMNRRPPFGVLARKVLPLLLSIALVVSPAARADGLPDLGDSARTDLTPQMERKIGESIGPHMRHGMMLYRMARLTLLVSRATIS